MKKARQGTETFFSVSYPICLQTLPPNPHPLFNQPQALMPLKAAFYLQATL